MKIIKYNSPLFILIFLSCIFQSCKKFIQIDPPETELTTETVFTNDQTAISAINGIYSKMMQSSNTFFNGGATFYTALSADEIITVPTNTYSNTEFLENNLLPNNNTLLQIWSSAYTSIYAANSILKNITGNTLLTPATRQQLEAEASFIRAFCFFNLVNLFGSIPYTETTDYQFNNTLKKSDRAFIYTQILRDLKKADTLLTIAYPTTEKARPNKATAAALLARVYLYQEDWVNAEMYSSRMIADPNYELVTDLNSVFVSSSKETIWQLRPVVSQYNTGTGDFFARTSGTTPYGRMTTQLQNAFETEDKRQSDWISKFADSEGDTAYLPFKYKIRTSPTPSEYNIVFRLAEQYLIRAEARAHQNNTGDAIDDLNTIRSRAGLVELPDDLSPTQVLDAVAQERKVELFAEWGHRWFDLKRTGKAETVLGAIKSGWQNTDVFYPIPQTELDKNANLLPQNAGYN